MPRKFQLFIEFFDSTFSVLVLDKSTLKERPKIPQFFNNNRSDCRLIAPFLVYIIHRVLPANRRTMELMSRFMG